ncbi:hypothetical protein EDD85DRAFT_1028207 [Armillaria nabsnona]|nr:hypothetical protein EDD85DRAFT_1028207 [Armillaria nabsnona]
MENIIRLSKEGSFEAMESLANQAANPVACRGFGIALDANLRYRIKGIQAMSQGRHPVVPSSHPKDPLNLSCNALHALSIGLKETYTAETFDLAFLFFPPWLFGYLFIANASSCHPGVTNLSETSTVFRWKFSLCS